MIETETLTDGMFILYLMVYLYIKPNHIAFRVLSNLLLNGRDRDYSRDRMKDSAEYDESSFQREKFVSKIPTNTIILKGLPTQLTESMVCSILY